MNFLDFFWISKPLKFELLHLTQLPNFFSLFLIFYAICYHSISSMKFSGKKNIFTWKGKFSREKLFASFLGFLFICSFVCLRRFKMFDYSICFFVWAKRGKESWNYEVESCVYEMILYEIFLSTFCRLRKLFFCFTLARHKSSFFASVRE